MQQRRTPFRTTLDRLAQEFAQGILDAVRRATLAEILGMPSAQARSDERRPTLQPVSTEGAKATARRAEPPRVRAARAPTRAPLPQAPNEPEVAEGTEIDARALLASIDAEPPPRAREREQSTTRLLEKPPAPRAPTPPLEPARRSTPALRDGEQALRTSSGHVVLRRRRTVESAA